MAAGNRHLAYKAALNAIEEQSPGTKASFYLNFIERMAPLLAGERAEGDDLHPCQRCRAPTTGEICAFCRVVEKSAAHEPVSVEVLLGRKGRVA